MFFGRIFFASTLFRARAHGEGAVPAGGVERAAGGLRLGVRFGSPHAVRRADLGCLVHLDQLCQPAGPAQAVSASYLPVAAVRVAVNRPRASGADPVHREHRSARFDHVVVRIGTRSLY